MFWNLLFWLLDWGYIVVMVLSLIAVILIFREAILVYNDLKECRRNGKNKKSARK